MPDIRVEPLQEEDEFLLIACDGLWDVFSNQSAIGKPRGDPLLLLLAALRALCCLRSGLLRQMPFAVSVKR